MRLLSIGASSVMSYVSDCFLRLPSVEMSFLHCLHVLQEGLPDFSHGD